MRKNYLTILIENSIPVLGVLFLGWNLMTVVVMFVINLALLCGLSLYRLARQYNEEAFFSELGVEKAFYQERVKISPLAHQICVMVLQNLLAISALYMLLEKVTMEPAVINQIVFACLLSAANYALRFYLSQFSEPMDRDEVIRLLAGLYQSLFVTYFSLVLGLAFYLFIGKMIIVLLLMVVPKALVEILVVRYSAAGANERWVRLVGGLRLESVKEVN